jgi:hypothetical protein
MDMFIFKNLSFIRSTEGEGEIKGCQIHHGDISEEYTKNW